MKRQIINLIAVLVIIVIITTLFVNSYLSTLEKKDCNTLNFDTSSRNNHDSNNSINSGSILQSLTESQIKMVAYTNQSDNHYDRVLDFLNSNNNSSSTSIGSNNSATTTTTKRLAYAFYITKKEYFCAAAITANRLRKWTDIDIVFTLVDTFYPDKRIVDKLNKLPNIYFKTFLKITPGHDGGSRWFESLNKLHIFRLVDYDRIIFLDADIYVLRNLDHLFALPDCAMAAPRAYWFKKEKQPFLTDTLMVFKPSLDTYYLLLHASTTNKGWDMDIVNEYFIDRNDFLLLPGIYGLLNFEFGIGQNHYFGSDFQYTYDHRAYLYHYSMFKPWSTKNGTEEVSSKGKTLERTWFDWYEGSNLYC